MKSKQFSLLKLFCSQISYKQQAFPCQHFPLVYNKPLMYNFSTTKSIKQSKKNPQNKKSIKVQKQITQNNFSIKPAEGNQLNKQKTNNKNLMPETQKSQLILQQKIKATYTELQSLPSDSYETVVQNFKRIKTTLMDRKVYLPNKPELLQKLDKNFQFIKQHHKTWIAPSTAPQRRITDSKSEIIEWELNQAKTQFFLSILQNQKILSCTGLGIITLFIVLQYNFFIVDQTPKERPVQLFL